MKRLISATLALTLLSGTAAVAAPADHGRNGYNQGYNQDYRGDRGRSNNSGAIIAGVGLLAIAAILASNSHDRYESDYRGYHQGWYNHGNRYDHYGRGYGYRGR